MKKKTSPRPSLYLHCGDCIIAIGTGTMVVTFQLSGNVVSLSLSLVVIGLLQIQPSGVDFDSQSSDVKLMIETIKAIMNVMV
jgi:hypothetical protein